MGLSWNLVATMFGEYAAYAGPSYLVSLAALAVLGLWSYRAREKAARTLSRLEQKPKGKRK